MTRARSEGIPSLNNVRRQIFAATNDGQLTPYTDWVDFGQHLKHPESLINFVAAYGTAPDDRRRETTLAGKRDGGRRADRRPGDRGRHAVCHAGRCCRLHVQHRRLGEHRQR